MRVLQFYKTAIPETMGGVEQAIDQIARATAGLGVTTDVLALTSANRASTVSMNGYRLHCVPLNFQIASSGFSASAFSAFSRLSKEVDLIHYHFPWPFMDLVHFVSGHEKPTLVTYHSDIIRQKTLLKLYRPLKNSFLRSVHQIVATSPNYAASSKVLQRFANKVTVIPLGLDEATYPNISLQCMESWQSRFGEKFFLFIGVLRYYKGLHVLLNALRHTGYPLVIIGTGPMEEELKAQACRLGLRQVYFLGHLNEMDKVALCKLCFALVFPSHLRSEAFGVSLLEGAMFGKPLISCEIGTGTSFVNVTGVTGLVIEPNNETALEGALRYLWLRPQLAKRMGENSRIRFSAIFTAERMAASYAKLYEKLIANSSASLKF